MVEVPLAPPAPKISRQTKSRSASPDKGAGDVLSVEETNKLRAKLGLKPLEVGDSAAVAETSDKPKKDAEGNLLRKDEWGEFYHKPAGNIKEKIEAEKIREKIRQRKEKRHLEDKLKRVRALGDDEGVDDAVSWVDRSREKEKLKADAKKRAKALEEMDEDFGVNDVIRQTKRDAIRDKYNDKSLRGLKVDHDLDHFSEGKTVVLTLKDKDVLDEEDDSLVNVNMVDEERYRRNIDNKKLNPNHYGYDVYEEEVDEFGQPIGRNILGKYDEEIEGGAGKKKTFKIGDNVEEERAHKFRLLQVS